MKMYEAAGDKDTQPSFLAVQTEEKAKQSILSLPLLKIVIPPGILKIVWGAAEMGFSLCRTAAFHFLST